MIIYLDTMIISRLANPRGKGLREGLLSYLQKNKATLAVSFHHIHEIVAIAPEVRGHDGESICLPLEIGRLLDSCPITQIDGGPAVVDNEFKEAVRADAECHPIRRISPPEWGRWKGPAPANGSHNISETLACIYDKDRHEAEHLQFQGIGKRNAEFRKQRKEAYKTGKEQKPQSLQAAIALEQDALRKILLRTNSCWPQSRIILSPHAVKEHREQFLRRFDFVTCPALNLFSVLMAYQHFNIGNQKTDPGGLTDPWHAALGCQYTDRFATEDTELLKALKEVRPLAPYRATVYPSLTATLAIEHFRKSVDDASGSPPPQPGSFASGDGSLGSDPFNQPTKVDSSPLHPEGERKP